MLFINLGIDLINFGEFDELGNFVELGVFGKFDKGYEKRWRSLFNFEEIEI